MEVTIEFRVNTSLQHIETGLGDSFEEDNRGSKSCNKHIWFIIVNIKANNSALVQEFILF